MLALLALREGEEAALWARVRAAQLVGGRQLALFLLGANLAAAAIVVILFSRLVTLPWLAGWSGALALVAVGTTVRRLRARHQVDGYASLNEMRQTWSEGAALALVWSSAAVFFGRHADPGTALALWMVLSVLMTAAAVAMAPLVTVAVGFIGGVSLAVTVALAISHAYVAAAGTALFAALLLIDAIGRAHAMVRLHGSELKLEKRDETVSLLLGEFEDSTADWLWETDPARRIVRASPRFAYACGLEPGAIEGMSFLQLLAGASWQSGDVAPALRELGEKLKRRESFRDLVVPVEVGERRLWWQIAASPRFDGNGTFVGFHGVGSDVTEHRLTSDRINRLARYDVLTGLPNRLLVTESLTHALEEAAQWNGRCGLMMIDLDRFKAINDTLGHPIGDRLLACVSDRLLTLMSGKELIGRLGGDEFAVVIPDARDTERLRDLARAIIHALSQPYEIDQHTLYIGASVGFATSPRDGRSTDTLIRSADLALYRSKDCGGGCANAYDPRFHVEAEERRSLEVALRQALENGELHLQYQPSVAAATGVLHGFEALLRWTHPTLGTIPPDKFISIAEEARLIAPIGEWVLRTACMEAARWPAPVVVAVNVSPEQLYNAAFVNSVRSALNDSGLPPARLELEVTESVFLRDGTAATRVLDAVIGLGVRLSLDDFGTGYSSLGYLSRTRFSGIKIDRSFVRAAGNGAIEAQAIIRAVVALASSLSMTTVAEGVETEDQLELVRMLGCSHIQGYYFGRPLPVEEARALAHRRRPLSHAA